MLFPTLMLAFASLSHAQSASESLTSVVASLESHTPSSSTPTPTISSSTKRQTTGILLPFYAPYPISEATDPRTSASALTSSSSFDTAKYWQHTYRDYYASIITVISTSTIVYAIDCAPNSAHPSYTKNDFQSFSVCGASVVGRGPMTVTQGPEQWHYAVSQTEPSLNLTQTRFSRPTTRTQLDITCEALTASLKSCWNAEPLTSSSAVVSGSLSWSQSLSSSISMDDGSEEQSRGEISSLLQNFSTMTEVLVTMTGGVEKIPGEMFSSLSSVAETITTAPVSSSSSSSVSASPSASVSAGVSQSSSTAAAPRITGAVGMEVMFGAAGVLGAAVFGF
ncbi:predicted protein [Plenodomus lingam JN3]|uniref:Predicted protein n=1 Tax=Leptosphaeria maculans (strain JN3 / isolate v23.1.3 / race Av1-4-5-6-7-8) TaxID=985895 RepID=E5A563_LEPMJ|nr:predicted protein [Plenodomus lingam JN3]CBX98761.1 predicted protein [Plenodomus lingam JN3]